ncbi:MAG: hypothetical protein IPI73_10200 [Betaproteobacteria bacterium]|nr:hypothetical protein [Betaproteobacteria bacterium]
MTAGTNLAYAITIDNAGPSDADSVSLSDTLPAGHCWASTTPDPAPAGATVVLSPSLVSGTKAVVGTPVVRGNVTYTVVFTNNGVSAQAIRPGSRVLPERHLSATATSGVVTTGPNTVYWNGAILAGDSVTITIVATVTIGAAGQVVGNQGGIFTTGRQRQHEDGGRHRRPVGGATSCSRRSARPSSRRWTGPACCS